MTRVKTSVTTRQRHKKIKSYAKGFYNRHKRSFKLANQLTRRAMVYRFADNKRKKREFRSRFIQIINSFARSNGSKYSVFINRMRSVPEAKLIDRKSLAVLIQNSPADATELFKRVLCTNS